MPEASEGDAYKYEVQGADGQLRLKADPFAFYAEVPPKTASRIYRSRYEWADDDWLERRRGFDPLKEPISTYEVHAESWRLGLGWKELAEQLVAYADDLGFTHVEFMPVMHHPFSGSWGYQVTGFYAPQATMGEPDEFRALVDALHQAGIGVILDWVPAHFPRDEFALARFDGTALYEHEDPRRGSHPDWGTLVFNLGRNEVRNFLIANALYWLREYHADGLRVDAVASMLYLDYSRKAGEWVPNAFGGREDLDAVSFLRELNEVVYGREPGVMTIAEESTAWPGVSRPTYLGGLGFGFKWNMGWMHDTLEYVSKEPVHRRFHHHELTFSMVYAWNENFVLPLSHDEVVHGKGSLLGKMPGDRWQRFANLRALYGYMWAHPGKQLLFMGCEFGQEKEWSEPAGSLDWHLLDEADHAGMLALDARPQRRLRRGAGALGARPHARGLPLAGAERGERERARLRAAERGRQALARRRLQLLARRARGVADRAAEGRQVARGAEHGLALLRRQRRRQRARSRDREDTLERAAAIGRDHAAAARRRVARARLRAERPRR